MLRQGLCIMHVGKAALMPVPVHVSGAAPIGCTLAYVDVVPEVVRAFTENCDLVVRPHPRRLC
jgi:hypothetical protein